MRPMWTTSQRTPPCRPTQAPEKRRPPKLSESENRRRLQKLQPRPRQPARRLRRKPQAPSPRPRKPRARNRPVLQKRRARNPRLRQKLPRQRRSHAAKPSVPRRIRKRSTARPKSRNPRRPPPDKPGPKSAPLQGALFGAKRDQNSPSDPKWSFSGYRLLNRLWGYVTAKRFPMLTRSSSE